MTTPDFSGTARDLPEFQGTTPTHSSDHGDDLHCTVVCAVDAIRAVLRGIPATNPATGAAMALQFIADGLSHAADKYESIELDSCKAGTGGRV